MTISVPSAIFTRRNARPHRALLGLLGQKVSYVAGNLSRRLERCGMANIGQSQQGRVRNIRRQTVIEMRRGNTIACPRDDQGWRPHSAQLAVKGPNPLYELAYESSIGGLVNARCCDRIRDK